MLQPLRNKTADTEPDAVASSRIIHIEFVPDQMNNGDCFEGHVIDCQGMDVTGDVKVDPSQLILN